AGRDGLQRRVPGAQLPSAPRQPDPVPAARPVHDASAAFAALDGFQNAVARAGTVSTAPLTRRTPGANLAPGLRDAPSGTPLRRPAGPQRRDPEADRAAFDGFVAGLAAADRQRTLTTDKSKEGSG